MNRNSLFSKFPFPIKQSLKYCYGAIPEKIRYGKVFRDTYKLLQESQWWTKKQLEEYQMQQLEKHLNHAYNNVPYYTRLFDERGLKPRDFQRLDDIKKLPYLTKEIIRENIKDLVARNYPKSKLKYVTTGGSTGLPLGFYHENKVSQAIEWAFIITLWQRAGYQKRSKRVVFAAQNVSNTDKDKFWYYNPIENTLTVSSFHLINENMMIYINKIREFNPDFLHGYPSVIVILARYMEVNRIAPFKNVKAVLCGSENFLFFTT